MIKNLWNVAKWQTKHLWNELSNGNYKWSWRLMLASIFMDGMCVGALL